MIIFMLMLDQCRFDLLGVDCMASIAPMMRVLHPPMVLTLDLILIMDMARIIGQYDSQARDFQNFAPMNDGRGGFDYNVRLILTI